MWLTVRADERIGFARPRQRRAVGVVDIQILQPAVPFVGKLAVHNLLIQVRGPALRQAVGLAVQAS